MFTPWHRASFCRLKEPSPHRRQPPIPAFPRHGGSELSHLIHQDNLAGLKKILYSTFVDSFNVAFFGKSVVICKICFIHITMPTLTSARCTYTHARAHSLTASPYRIGHVCFGDQSSCRAESHHRTSSRAGYLLTAICPFKGHIFMRSPGIKQESMAAVPQDLSPAPHQYLGGLQLSWEHRRPVLEVPSRTAKG